jgi:ElaB/YqjD/DUF883 family membrane-anchored ribosome-binding protein
MEHTMNEKDINVKVSDQLADIEDRLKEIKDRTTDFVQKHPLTAVAIAVGVGYVIAKLISGRRS